MTGRVEDTRYNPLPRRVAVPLYPCPHPQVRTAFAWLRGLSAPGALLEEARALVAAKLHVSPESVSFTSSGSSGLVLALRSVRTDSANEVMVPTFACHRVLEAVLAADMVPVLCDIDGNGNIDPHDMATRLSPRTRAVIATHTFGIPADLSTLSRMCRDADIHLIDDAAQGFGTVYDGRPVGSWGTFGVLSFGRHKPFFAGAAARWCLAIGCHWAVLCRSPQRHPSCLPCRVLSSRTGCGGSPPPCPRTLASRQLRPGMSRRYWKMSARPSTWRLLCTGPQRFSCRTNCGERRPMSVSSSATCPGSERP